MRSLDENAVFPNNIVGVGVDFVVDSRERDVGCQSRCQIDDPEPDGARGRHQQMQVIDCCLRISM